MSTTYIVKTCIPTMFALVMTGLYSVVDGLYVGISAGDTGLAAINIAWPIPAILIASGIGIGSGGSVQFSQKLGEGDESACKQIFGTTLLLLLFFTLFWIGCFYPLFPQILRLLGATGSVYTQAHSYARLMILGCFMQLFTTGLLPILRNMNLHVCTMWCSLSGMLANLILNYIFIVHLDLGITGAAIGTISSQAIVLSLIYFFMRKHKRGLSFGIYALDFKIIYSILRSAIAPFGISLAPSVVLIFTNLVCLSFGGSEAVACYAVISYITFPVQSLLAGIGDGLQPLLSFSFGAKKTENLSLIVRTGKRLGALTGLACTSICCLFANPLASVFHMSPLAQSYFQVGLKYSSLSFLFTAFVKFQTAYENSIGNSKKASLFVYGETLLVAPLTLLGLSYFLGLDGIWLSLPATQCLMFAFISVYSCVFTIRSKVIS